MKILRDSKGRIIQIIKEESDGDFNMETILKIESDKEIAKEKEKTMKFQEAMNTIPLIIEGICAGANEYLSYEKKEDSEEPKSTSTRKEGTKPMLDFS